MREIGCREIHRSCYVRDSSIFKKGGGGEGLNVIHVNPHFSRK